jgi:hypothetical protein
MANFETTNINGMLFSHIKQNEGSELARRTKLAQRLV